MCISKNRKIFYAVFMVALISLLICILPALGRYKNAVTLSDARVWSGNVASSYRSGNGTRNNPFIISSPEELAYFAQNLEDTSYNGKYFKIINDIIINNGYFTYENTQLMYHLDGNTYFVNDNKYYSSQDFTTEEVGTLNMFPSLSSFEGHLDGGFKTIYGYYSSAPIFNNISGSVSSLYINNVVVKNKAIVTNSIVNGTLDSIYVSGLLIDDSVNNYYDDTTLYSDYDSINLSINSVFATYSENSTMSNLINRADVYGGDISGIFVGYGIDATISSSYSYGNCYSNDSSLAGIIKGNSTISNIYNAGTINKGLIGYLINSNLAFSNSFISTNNYVISHIYNSNIDSQNIYYTHETNNNLVIATRVSDNNLKDKNYLTNYNEFVSLNNYLSNNQNKWVFNGSDYPLLYFDDKSNNHTLLYLNREIYDSYSLFIDKKYISSNISFTISDDSQLLQTDKYYYINNQEQVLSVSDLENVLWTSYTEPVTIQNEGGYVVYVKVVDLSGEVTYINSDNIVIDKTNPLISIDFNNNTYSSINNNEVYINNSAVISAGCTDNSQDSVSLVYFLTDDVNDLSTVQWTDYVNPININSSGKYILYVRATDLAGNISYASTPLIIYDGFVVSNLKPVGFESGNVITKKSAIMMNIRYQSTNEQTFNHYLVSNVDLPIGTRIIMLDKSDNNTYSYTVSQNDSVSLNNKYYYNFNLFNTIGKRNSDAYTNSLAQSEEFEFIIDFSSSNISVDIQNMYLNIIGLDSNMDVIRPYVNEELFSVLSSDSYNTSYNLSTNFVGNINYNTDSRTNITLYSNVLNTQAIDTSFKDKTTGVLINIVDSNNNIINRDHYKSITFSAFDKIYVPDSNGNIKINLNSNTSSSFILKISTYKSLNNLVDGNYNIVITPYISYDGETIISQNDYSKVVIPLVNSSEEKNYTYTFDVTNNKDMIFNKPSLGELDYNIIVGGLLHPNVKFSLYKKNTLSAYNQAYTLVDIQNYTSTILDEYVDNVYFATRRASIYNPNNPASINRLNLFINTQNMPKGSYKLSFDLYENQEYINSINKYFIVR